MYLLVLEWDVWRNIEYVRFHGVDKDGVELSDEIVVALLAIGMGEGVPWQSVNVPGVVEVDVAEAQGDGSA